ncbi:hypothetical protein L0P88_08495 [Muricauda sp. SCSIO 64092]|uniref:hypothetical protein n=1 Tax=Allomuricauda sp. SCSIO 64092 TaxID=2908842 RepID=UPI001FF36671|nr:hypothetical protein [Muricauda sp. SCSIO 64092]UOY08579.1 hypothetical protein L0P88_08495 [Muricauda sp. SCSIO 64092]
MDYKNELEQKIEHKVTDYVAKGFKIFFFALFMVGLLFLIGYVVMLLWNWLMPELFGLTTITYWQAFGILILAKIIFGFGGGNGPGKKYKRKWKSQRTPKSCGPLRKDFSEWKYYDRFWKEEGESAFKAYVEKQRNHGEKE